jgi:outer membrane beta-barrel protein
MIARSVALIAVIVAVVPEARAQVGGASEVPRIFSIQPRPYRLGHEFQLGLGVLPMDAFYVGGVLGASYTYHFSDFWAWEIANAGYSLNFDTSLREELRQDYNLEPVRGGGDRIHLYATSSVVVKPLFGKLALFNSDVVHSETYFTAGGGLLLKGDVPLFTVVFGLGLRFWSSDVVSLRFDVKDYLMFAGYVPANTMMFMLSASLNVFDPSAADSEADGK